MRAIAHAIAIARAIARVIAIAIARAIAIALAIARVCASARAWHVEETFAETPKRAIYKRRLKAELLASPLSVLYSLHYWDDTWPVG